MDKVQTLQKEYLNLLNRRKEAIILQRKKNNIALQGENLESVPDLKSSWAGLSQKYSLSTNFLKGISEGGYARPTPV